LDFWDSIICPVTLTHKRLLHMGFEELSPSHDSPSSRFDHLSHISARVTETRASEKSAIETNPKNNIVKGPQSSVSPNQNLPIPSLIADAALITTLVSGISTGILLELPEQALPPLEQFRSLIAGAILADNPKDYQKDRSAQISSEIFRAPELTTEAKTKKHSTPCSPLSRTKIREKAQQLNSNWQRCLAPEFSSLPKSDTHSPKPSQHHLDKTDRSHHGKR
jgi:hypothetical protein